MKPEDFVHGAEAHNTPVYMQYKGILDMQDLYESIADFFRQKKFKFYEKQQRLRRPGPFGVEVLHSFEARREIEDFYEWVVNVNIETFDMHDVEVVMKNGRKKKMAKGRIWIQILGKVVMDYERIWEKNAFLAYLKSFYIKYVIRKRIDSYWWDELQYKIVLRLHALIKERLKMASEGSEFRHMAGVH
ncbi:hypothetical protein HYS31_05025 [Candidatus Woesearchaeota archaeon]|nr:hypothetical protein [Candidatus Woesearchaeota archaeon]